jgi:ATP-dependent exoDNAse (exonuclease V) beta subunit
MKLTPAQEACVQARAQDVCVVAGPGSGKTRVLIERFRWLVESEGIDPRRILAITFTEKAANEIKKRLVDAFAGRPDLRAAIERAWVSTIHGFCLRLLKEHAITAGVDPEFTVLDGNDADAGLEEAALETLDQLLADDVGRLRGLLAGLYVSSSPNSRQPDLAQALIEVYEAVRVAGKTVSDLRGAPVAGPTLDDVRQRVRLYLAGAGQGASDAQRRKVAELHAWLATGEEPFRALASFPCKFSGLKAGNPYYDAMKPLRDEVVPAARAALIAAHNAPYYDFLIDAVRRIDACWRQRKREMGALDFSDLEEAAVSLLRDEPGLAARVRVGFDAVLMDELQDTNPLQWRLVDLLRRPDRFFAVGDVNQSIFGFRHAEPEVFRRYRDSVAAAGKPVHELRQNHRSREEILEAVNDVFAAAVGVEPHTLVPSDKYAPGSEPPVEVFAAETRETEAAWIARRILELKSSLALEFSDFAVLGRSLRVLDDVHLALARAGIPALLVGGRGFFETREVRDLTLWLGVLANPRDTITLAGLLRSPLVGLRDETLLRLALRGSLESLDPVAALDPEDRARLVELRARMARLRPLRDAVSPDRLAAAALDEVDYLATLPPHGRANVEKFLGLIRDLYARRPRTLRETLEELDRLRTAAAEPEAPPGESADAVLLMTIHKSKGLEFPVVFVPALDRGTDRGRPVICFDPAAGLGVRWRDPAGPKGIADATHKRFTDELSEKERAEENRLLYVAMTRAEEHLALSFVGNKTSAGVNLLAPLPTPEVTGIPEGRIEAQPGGEAPPEEIVPRPEVTGQYDSTVPVTSIAAFHACPRRYYLGRYIGAVGHALACPDHEWRDLDPTELGRQAHALLAGEEVPNPHPEALELAGAFGSTELGQRAARASRAGRESGFLFALGDVVLRGQIDLWFEEGGELVLVDYKTDRVKAADAQRLAPYRLQLRLYALALQRLVGRLPDRGFLHLLRSGESVAVDLAPSLLEEAQMVVDEFRRAQDALEFPLREGVQCASCEFFGGSCPAAAHFL